MSQKSQDLVLYMERWLSASPRRSLSLLARISGVSYPTIRRIVRFECVPSLDNTIALLNQVATLEESIQYVEKNDSIRGFCERFRTHELRDHGHEHLQALFNRNRFWIMVLALTLGVSQNRVEKLLGKFGVLDFDRMVREGSLVEMDKGLYRPTYFASDSYIDSQAVAREVTQHIAEAPIEKDCLKRFLFYNVNEETYRKMKREVVACFSRLDQLAKNNQGPLVVVSSLSILSVFTEEPDFRKDPSAPAHPSTMN